MLTNPWVLIGVAVVWALSLLGVGKWQYRAGSEHERGAWQAREVEQVTAANAAIKRLNDEARAKERARVDEMTTLATNYSKGFRDAEARRKADVAAARDGALVLRIPASACRPGGGEAPAAGASAAGGDGAETIALPRTVAADLLSLAHDADQVADQLRACQTIVLNDRKE